MLLFQHQAAGGESNGCSEDTLEEILWQLLIKLTLEQLPLGLYMLIFLNREFAQASAQTRVWASLGRGEIWIWVKFTDVASGTEADEWMNGGELIYIRNRKAQKGYDCNIRWTVEDESATWGTDLQYTVHSTYCRGHTTFTSTEGRTPLRAWLPQVEIPLCWN